MKITVEVPSNLEAQIGEVAARLNVSLNDLAEAAVRDLVTRPDEDFERAASKVIAKNRELYRRLA